MENKYDVVIIGSGMGGLACANILAQEGKKVLVLEKNSQLGGNLQVFNRDKCVFDTGVHYLGGLDEGQILNHLFKYFGILKDLKLKRMDEDGFDRIHFFNEKEYYHYGIGYDNFIETLVKHFPEERKAIEKYCSSIKSIVNGLPLAQLKMNEDDSISGIDFSLNAKDYINSLTDNKQLQKVLAGNNTLYAGSVKTPFYAHALVLHYYIESSWKCVDGAGQIAKFMAKRIRDFGGELMNRSEVVSANYTEDGKVESVNLANGKIVRGDVFISNVHPSVTIDIFGKDKFQKSYVDRIQNLKNTSGLFLLHLVFKENSFEYFNYNIFQNNLNDVWHGDESQINWPSYYMISCPVNSKNSKFAKGMSIICGMHWSEVEKWKDSYNNVTDQRSRGEDYENFKREKSEKVIDAISFHFPDIREKIKSYSSSTPLTQRDYTASPNGSGYGIEKDSNAPFKTLINAKTSIPNLFLTGQNLTLHGILGVSLTALLTCFNLVDKKKLLNKINSKTVL